MGNTQLGVARVFRFWEVDGHVIILKTSPKLACDIYVDGKEIYREKRKTTGVHNITSHSFRLDGKRATIHVLGSSTDKKLVKNPWVLTVEGETIPDSLQIPCPDDSYNLYNISIRNTKIFRQPNGKPVTMYTVDIEHTQENGRTTTVERRFNEFAKLDENIRSSFYRNHLLTSIPSFPSKMNLANAKSQFMIMSQSATQDEELVQKRKVELEVYLRKLVTIPRVAFNPFMRSFLGLDPPLELLAPAQYIPNQFQDPNYGKSMQHSAEQFAPPVQNMQQPIQQQFQQPFQQSIQQQQQFQQPIQQQQQFQQPIQQQQQFQQPIQQQQQFQQPIQQQQQFQQPVQQQQQFQQPIQQQQQFQQPIQQQQQFQQPIQQQQQFQQPVQQQQQFQQPIQQQDIQQPIAASQTPVAQQPIGTSGLQQVSLDDEDSNQLATPVQPPTVHQQVNSGFQPITQQQNQTVSGGIDL